MADKQEITIKLSLDDKDLQKEIKINVDDKEVEGLKKLAELTGKDLNDLENIQIRIGKGALPIIALGISAASANEFVQAILAAIAAFEAGRKVGDFINSKRLPPESRSVLDEPPPRTRVLVQQDFEKRLRESKSGGLDLSDEDIAQLTFLLERYKEQLLSSSEIEKELTKISLERIRNIMNLTEELKNQDGTIDNNNQTLKDLTDTTIKDNEENQKSIILKKNNSQSLLDLGNTQSASAMAAREHTESLKGQADEILRGNEILELTDEELLGLQGKYAMLTDESGNYTDAAKQASTTTAELTDQNSTLETSQDQVNKSLNDGSDAYNNAGESADKYGDKVEQLQNQGGFFEGIKQGFEDFVESVGSNSELIADFFANTLSQMSQNFSDLFYNVLTGKFEDLKDLAKQAFEAILRSFLDLVAAIATRQIVISIGGLFGIGKGAQAAGGGGSNPLDLAQQGAGVIGSGVGLSLSGSSQSSTFGASFMNPSSGVMTPGAQAGTFFTPEMQAQIEGTAPPTETGGGIGAGIGAGLLGISLGSAIGGIINSDLTGFQQGISFGVGAVGVEEEYRLAA